MKGFIEGVFSFSVMAKKAYLKKQKKCNDVDVYLMSMIYNIYNIYIYRERENLHI